MAIAGLGNGGVPTTKIEALAGELRLLKCGLADMQGRLDALLVEIDAELQGAQSEGEPAVEVTEVVAEIASEPAIAEIAEVTVPAGPTVETQSVVDAIPTVDGSEPVAPVEVWAEAIVPAGEQIDTPAAELPGQNIVVLDEHRAKTGKSRGVIGRTARWAAAIALIATVAAVAAAGTGFAGNGERLTKSLCAVAGEGCSITLGMP